MRKLALLLLLILLPWGCAPKAGGDEVTEKAGSIINPQGAAIQERFLPPEGYKRLQQPDHSFAAYLCSLPLKPHDTKVRYFDGQTKRKEVYEAVIDLDIGERDLQQCADAVIRLRAEYLFKEKKFDKIRFNFTSGFPADYLKWREGYRITVQGNSASWVKRAGPSAGYQDFRKYLDMVFAYAGTQSLARELMPVKLEDMEPGDVFIQGGSPGHCVIVVDMAVNEGTGEKLFMLAQSYMPAQDIQILKNPHKPHMSPWYHLNFADKLDTPEWTFTKDDLKRFPQG